MLVARVQEVRFGDHHSSAVPPLPEAARLAAMTYPDGFAAVATADTPAKSWVMDPLARCQVVPSVVEVSMTGPGPPAASQPADPCVTLVSADRPG